MTHDTRLKDLFTKQEAQIFAFERHRASMLQCVQTTEKEILQYYGCTFADAPPDALNIITKLREDYNLYWGSPDGILLTELMRRQAAARQRIIDSMKNNHNKS